MQRELDGLPSAVPGSKGDNAIMRQESQWHFPASHTGMFHMDDGNGGAKLDSSESFSVLNSSPYIIA